MSPNISRIRFGAAVAAAFAGGLIVASGFDLTRFGYAQQTGAPAPSAQDVRPLAETGNAFVSIAEHVTPAVVSIQSERAARTTSNQQQQPRNRRAPHPRPGGRGGRPPVRGSRPSGPARDRRRGETPCRS